MKLRTFIKHFEENKCNIQYNGSLNIQTDKPFSPLLYKAYLDSLLLFQNQNSIFNNSEIEEGAITQSGVSLLLNVTIEELIEIAINKCWKYSVTCIPLDNNRQIVKEITVWVDTSPISIKAVEYIDA